MAHVDPSHMQQQPQPERTGLTPVSSPVPMPTAGGPSPGGYRPPHSSPRPPGHRLPLGHSHFTQGSQLSMPSLLSAPLSCSVGSYGSEGSSCGSQGSDLDHWGHWRLAGGGPRRPQPGPTHPVPPAPPKRKDATGRTIVTTPWFPQGVAKSGLSLSDEVRALWRLLQLTEEEKSARTRARVAMQEAAGAVWPGVTVKLYGSFAYGLSLPHSDLDLVCEGCGNLSTLDGLVERLQGSGYDLIGDVVRDGQQALVHMHCRQSNVTCSVSFVSGRSPARKSVHEVRKLLHRWPAVPAVFAVLRLVFQQSRCGDAGDGGIPSYAVLVMILHACHQCERADEAGHLLIEFCQLYGAAGPAAQESLWVEDPITPDNNVVAGCVKLPQARQVLYNCHLALLKWGKSKWDGYRGRSPLSGILAHGQLWHRAEVKKEELAAWAQKEAEAAEEAQAQCAQQQGPRNPRGGRRRGGNRQQQQPQQPSVPQVEAVPPPAGDTPVAV